MTRIDGCFDNGKGLFSFCRINIKKMKELYNHRLSFTIMSYFLIELVDACQSNNAIFDWIHVSIRILQDVIPDLTEKDFKKVLNRLRKMELIEFKKLRGEESWEIQIL